ncbi:4683_t:CDS:2, partial [Acaulospora morrowiae]
TLEATMASVGAKTLWVRNVWKKFLESETGFDYVLMKHLKVTDATDGKVSAEMPVEPQHLVNRFGSDHLVKKFSFKTYKTTKPSFVNIKNRLNSMHGGMIATLVDIGGSLAIAAKGMNSTGLSTDI